MDVLVPGKMALPSGGELGCPHPNMWRCIEYENALGE
jgi:hypothetical protein